MSRSASPSHSSDPDHFVGATGEGCRTSSAANELINQLREYRRAVHECTSTSMSDCNNSSLEDRPGSSSTSLVTQEENDEASLPSPTLSLSQRSASANSMESQEPRQEPQIVESDCVVASQESGQVVAAEGAGRYSDQHGSQSGSSVPLSSLRGIARAVTQTKEISVEQLGEALSHSHIGEEYNRFIQYTIRECRIDVENARSLQLAVADVPQSSDSVVRAQLAVIARLSDAVVGMAALIDSLMTQTNSLHVRCSRVESAVSKNASSRLPEGSYLSAKNLTSQWIVRESSPFKATNLNQLMAYWRRALRARPEDHTSQCVDFMRQYLVQACNPAQVIQDYTYRMSGRYQKKPNLKDLPEDIADTLIGCCLDGLKLYAPELDGEIDHLIENPTRYWLTLGNNDTARAKKFHQLRGLRLCWRAILRGALARAMADIRQYLLTDDRLVPRPKRRCVDSSQSEQAGPSGQ